MPERETRPLTVLGAGISGLTTAINLAARGKDVTVLERAETVGSRFSGDFQGLENWTSSRDMLGFLEDINIPPDFEHEPFKECTVYDSDLNSYHLESSRVGFYLIRRGPMPGSLDSFLLDTARRLGVEVRFGESARPDEVDVIATGGRDPLLIATGMNFETDMEKVAFSLIDDDIAPLGYAYLLGVHGHGTLAVVSTVDTTKLSASLDRAVEAFSKIMSFQISDPRRFGGKGTYFRELGCGVPAVGEAGSFQDAMWGFGLRMAFHSGYLAAKALAEGLDYWSLVDAQLVPHCRSSVVNRWLYYLLSENRYRQIIARMSRSDDPVALTNRLYAPTLAKRLLFPLACRSVTKRHISTS